MVDTGILIRKLNRIYGEGKGVEICMTILPGILGDFRKMLAASPIGKTIREEYRLDDGKGTVVLIGTRTAAGGEDLTADLIQNRF